MNPRSTPSFQHLLHSQLHITYIAYCVSLISLTCVSLISLTCVPLTSYVSSVCIIAQSNTVSVYHLISKHAVVVFVG